MAAVCTVEKKPVRRAEKATFEMIGARFGAIEDLIQTGPLPSSASPRTSLRRERGSHRTPIWMPTELILANPHKE